MITDTDYSQARTIINATISKYKKEDIEAALGQLEPPAYLKPDVDELTAILGGLEKAYDKELFWKVFQEKGYKEITSAKESGTIYWNFGSNNIASINLNGKYEYKSLSENSWELKILEDDVIVNISYCACGLNEKDDMLLTETVPVNKEARIIRTAKELRIITV